METTPKISSEIAKDKQKIRYETELDRVTYQVTMTLNASGDGAKDAEKSCADFLKTKYADS